MVSVLDPSTYHRDVISFAFSVAQSLKVFILFNAINGSIIIRNRLDLVWLCALSLSQVASTNAHALLLLSVLHDQMCLPNIERRLNIRAARLHSSLFCDLFCHELGRLFGLRVVVTDVLHYGEDLVLEQVVKYSVSGH